MEENSKKILENMEENSKKIGKIWKKGKLNSEKIGQYRRKL